MGNCAAAKLGIGDEDRTVVLVRDRKRLMKATIKHHQALAEVHDRYTHSLYTVAAAIGLFVTFYSYNFSGEEGTDNGTSNGDAELVQREEGSVEFFDALGGIEEQLIKAYKAGKAISKMLGKKLMLIHVLELMKQKRIPSKSSKTLHVIEHHQLYPLQHSSLI